MTTAKTLNQLTLLDAVAKVKAGEISAAAVRQACAEAIKTNNQQLNAFLTTNDDLQTTATAQQPLAGLPLALKDNFCQKNVRTTASSLVLDQFIPPYSATVVEKLLTAGAFFLGKTNLDAWAHGSSTETSDYGPTKNPRNLAHSPGGSSGGSAAAVAADLCLAAIGSETGGSIRQPAAWCGCVGARPSYGRASRFGIAAMASSTDTPGVITKTVADAAYLLPLICGRDPRDATSSPEPLPDLMDSLTDQLQGKKIGFLYLDEPGLEPVRSIYQQVINDLKKIGATVDLATARNPQEAIGVYTVVQRSEVSSNLARYDGIRYGQPRNKFGDEAKRRIILGTFLLSQGYADKYYIKAQQVRTLFKQDFARLFQQYDVLVSPTSPSFAKKLGASEGAAMFGELEDKFVEPSAICGLPSMSVPCYHDPATNLYLGLNIMAPIHREDLVFAVGSAYEHHTTWNSWQESHHD